MTDPIAQSHTHQPPARDLIFVMVYLGLLVMTALTIGVSRIHLGAWSSAIAVLIASFKASLVLWFFMGLKYDKPIFRYMFLVTILSYGTFLAITYLDYLTR